jgi:hypothetical protein
VVRDRETKERERERGNARAAGVRRGRLQLVRREMAGQMEGLKDKAATDHGRSRRRAS